MITKPTFDELLAETGPVLQEICELYDKLAIINERWNEYYKGKQSYIRFSIEEHCTESKE